MHVELLKSESNHDHTFSNHTSLHHHRTDCNHTMIIQCYTAALFITLISYKFQILYSNIYSSFFQ